MRPRAALAATVAFLLVPACRREAPPPRPALATPFTLSVPYDIDTLDPHARDRLDTFAISSHFYEPLVGIDAEMGVYPRLARRWSNPDLLTWVFSLQPGATFHDGRPCAAEDVVFSFERLLRVKDLDIGVYVAAIASVKALDPQTVEIRTHRPTGVLLNKISSVLIVPRGTPEGALVAHENGTGPYRLVEWRKGVEILMRRHDGYWARRPELEQVRFRLDRSSDQARQDLLEGSSHFAQVKSRDIAAQLEARADLALLHRTGLFLKYLGFDLARDRTPFVGVRGGASPGNPFRKRAVREAVSLALDRKALVSGLRTFAAPARQVVPPFIFGFDPRLPELAFDPAKARKLLADAGYPEGFDVTLHVRKVVGEAAPQVRDMLAAVGIRVTLVELQAEEFFALATNQRPSFFLTRFGCSTGDASDVLDAGFHSVDEARHFGTSNVAAHSDPALDREIEASAEVLEMAARREHLQRLMAKIMAETLWVPLYFDEDVYAMQRAFAWRPRADSYVLAWEFSVAR